MKMGASGDGRDREEVGQVVTALEKLKPSGSLIGDALIWTNPCDVSLPKRKGIST
jgi:hypothetical protein